ncbi:23S rRNA pseudouridine(1911/1915/1917) synthase RluD [Rhodanobacter sp. PCA2]|uniref:23S rRNA pseudouridine(1911/1915/1917) synthase RluD n=1 Tax=Rhodanobacter sp. PCA2 TaxID=2006117 RepID=UPI0015E6B60B|nr:23S rRNA pseudouridine(1911/1915/1917) synthase RluD [Rhodanobacter sp. PCA2]MBA2077664.1 23S rRNA pseudouridine(1911/1915/1917) synthase [Rhodanobacter sp. PCA2]
MTAIRHEARVPLTAAGRRFDQTLAELFPDYSRSRLSAWIKSGAATLDGATAAPRQLLRGGEQVRLEAELEAEVASAPEAIELAIVHEDEHLLVLDKPPGLVVHPGAGNPSGTLLNALLHHDPRLAELPRAGIVHRLDKDTSGLMVVAKTLPAMTALVEMLSRHDVERQYEAVVLGSLVAGGTVDAPIGRSMGDRLRQAVRDDESGKHAVTHYRLRERFRAHSLIQCNLETGRTHQIRVHLTHVGHPLVGDPLYGGGLKLPRRATPELVAALRGFRRQALHAERLAFTHPVSGEALAFAAERPADMTALIAALRDDLAAHGHDDD